MNGNEGVHGRLHSSNDLSQALSARERALDLRCRQRQAPVAERTRAHPDAPASTQLPERKIRDRHRCTGALDICQERVELRFGLRGRDRLHVARLACIRTRSVRLRFARRAGRAAPRETSRPATSLAPLRDGDTPPLAQVACRSRCPAAELPSFHR
jgi:hypothetical protein